MSNRYRSGACSMHVWRPARTTMLLVIACAAVMTTVASAQSATGRVSGVVFDSIHGRPLANATVTLTPGSLHTTTGSQGTFLFDSVSAGDYTVTVRAGHALLDNLTKTIKVAAGQWAIARVSTRSAQSLLQQYCPSTDPNRSALIGRIWDVTAGGAATGTSVTLAYGAGRAASFRDTVHATPDSTGVFAFCALPSGFGGNVWAKAASRTISILVGDDGSGIETVNLAVGVTAVPVRGRVTTVDGTPLNHASVMVIGGNRPVFANATGAFVIPDAPPGTQRMFARAFGYTQIDTIVDLGPGATNDVVFALQIQPPQLASVDVTISPQAMAILDEVGFLDRKDKKSGLFMTRSDWANKPGQDLFDIFKGVHFGQLRVQMGSGAARDALTWGARMDNHPCIWLDGIYEKDPEELDALVGRDNVAAIEAYEPGTNPGRFRTDECRSSVKPTVVIWTRWRIDDWGAPAKK